MLVRRSLKCWHVYMCDTEQKALTVKDVHDKISYCHLSMMHLCPLERHFHSKCLVKKDAIFAYR